MNVEKSKYYIVFIIGVIIVIGLTVASFYNFPNDDVSLNLAIARTLFSAITIPIVVVGFYFTTIQLRKASAKPKLELFFTDTNNSEKSIKIRPVEEEKHYLSMSIVNKGNAITDMFQISYYVPKIYNPTIHYYDLGNEDLYYNRIDGDIEIVSFVNKHQYACFVDMPTPIPSLVLNTYKKEYSNITNELVIPYKIYGDWAEPHKGKLKVIINKQEVPHVPTSS